MTPTMRRRFPWEEGFDEQNKPVQGPPPPMPQADAPPQRIFQPPAPPQAEAPELEAPPEMPQQEIPEMPEAMRHGMPEHQPPSQWDAPKAPPQQAQQGPPPMPRTEQFFRQQDAFQNRKEPGKARQIIGGALAATRLRGAAPYVTGQAGRERELENLKVSQAGANEEQQGITQQIALQNAKRQGDVGLSTIERNKAQALAAGRTPLHNVAPNNTVLGADNKPVFTAPPPPAPAAAPARTIEGMATEILRNEKLLPEQKKAKLEELKSANNLLHPEKPITHFETDDKGNIHAVSVNPAAVASAPGGRMDLGPGGKTKAIPAGSRMTGDLTNDQVKRAQDLQNEARLDPEQKTYQAVRDAYQGMGAAAKQGDGLGDLTMMRLFAKLTDPLTGVREEEYRTMQGSLGALNRLGVVISGKWLRGEQLTPEGRASFMAMATPLLQQRQANYTRSLDRIKDKAVAYGIPPELVLKGLYPQDNQQGGGLPQGGGKPIDEVTAQAFYDAAGKDPVKAQRLAEQNGWVVAQ